MDYTLVPYGMPLEEDEELRFFFTRPDEPLEVSERSRWNALRRRFDEWWDWDANSVVSLLSGYYKYGVRDQAHGTKAAQEEYYRVHPHVEGPVGRPNYARDVERRKTCETLVQFVWRLYAREVAGTESGHDRLILRTINDELAKWLEKLVRDYKGRKGFLERQQARYVQEQRERERVLLETARVAATAGDNSTKSKPRRRWGELRPEPEVIQRRRG